jgi:hypothetical protein
MLKGSAILSKKLNFGSEILVDTELRKFQIAVPDVMGVTL